MKKITLRRDVISGTEKLNSVVVFKMVAAQAPGRAIMLDEMRKRVRILDALEALIEKDDHLLLEDEDHKVFAAAMEGYPWGMASRGLLTIIEDVLKAEEPDRLKVVS